MLSAPTPTEPTATRSDTSRGKKQPRADYGIAVHETMSAIVTESGLPPEEIAGRSAHVDAQDLRAALAGTSGWWFLMVLGIADALGVDFLEYIERIEAHADRQRKGAQP